MEGRKERNAASGKRKRTEGREKGQEKEGKKGFGGREKRMRGTG